MANYFNLTDFNFNLNITSDVYNEALELQNNFYDGNANLDLSRIEKKIFEIRRRLKIMQSAAPESGVDSMKSILLEIRADVYSIVGDQSLMQKFVRYNYRKKYLSNIYVDAFNFKTNYTNWLFTTGQIPQVDKESTIKQLEIDKSIFETYNDLYPSSYVEKFKIDSELWNELRDLYLSTFEIESEGIASWNSIIKEYMFNFYEEVYNKYMVNNDFVNYTGPNTFANPLTQQYNDLINGRDSSIADVAVSISVLNAEYDDAATTEERKSEITTEIVTLNSNIETFNSEKNTINEEYSMIMGFYSNYYSTFNTPNYQQLNQVLLDTKSYIMNIFVNNNVWNLDLVRLTSIENSSFIAQLPNTQAIWVPGVPSQTEWMTDPTSGLLYSTILSNIFTDLHTTYDLATPDYISQHAVSYVQAILSAKKLAKVKQTISAKLEQYSTAITAKQAQVDGQQLIIDNLFNNIWLTASSTDPNTWNGKSTWDEFYDWYNNEMGINTAILGTYGTELSDLNSRYQMLLLISNDADEAQSAMESAQQNIISQFEDVADDTFNDITKAVTLMDRLGGQFGYQYPSWATTTNWAYSNYNSFIDNDILG